MAEEGAATSTRREVARPQGGRGLQVAAVLLLLREAQGDVAEDAQDEGRPPGLGSEASSGLRRKGRCCRRFLPAVNCPTRQRPRQLHKGVTLRTGRPVVSLQFPQGFSGTGRRWQGREAGRCSSHLGGDLSAPIVAHPGSRSCWDKWMTLRPEGGAPMPDAPGLPVAWAAGTPCAESTGLALAGAASVLARVHSRGCLCAGDTSACPTVKEWFVYSGNPLRHPDLVRPLQMNIPGTDDLDLNGALMVHCGRRAQGWPLWDMLFQNSTYARCRCSRGLKSSVSKVLKQQRQGHCAHFPGDSPPSRPAARPCLWPRVLTAQAPGCGVWLPSWVPAEFRQSGFLILCLSPCLSRLCC